ncbi:DUF6702 family protein [Ekhidna sp.]|uniref:DUF6702 family protein n=1 Tax=Ekhidna sp. TaxID=2608089 RepID=UPI0032987FC2
MKRLLSVTLILLFGTLYGHDIRMAIFEIYEGDCGLVMNVSADRYYFSQTLKNEFPSRFKDEHFEQITWEYLQDKVAIEIDGNCTAFEINEIEYSEENIFIRGKLNLILDDVKEVKMTNTCMIDFIDGHDNIMKLKLNDRTRSFRLNSKRTSTTASYKE